LEPRKPTAPAHWKKNFQPTVQVIKAKAFIYSAYDKISYNICRMKIYSEIRDSPHRIPSPRENIKVYPK